MKFNKNNFLNYFHTCAYSIYTPLCICNGCRIHLFLK